MRRMGNNGRASSPATTARSSTPRFGRRGVAASPRLGEFGGDRSVDGPSARRERFCRARRGTVGSGAGRRRRRCRRGRRRCRRGFEEPVFPANRHRWFEDERAGLAIRRWWRVRRPCRRGCRRGRRFLEVGGGSDGTAGASVSPRSATASASCSAMVGASGTVNVSPSSPVGVGTTGGVGLGLRAVIAGSFDERVEAEFGGGEAGGG